ncbi:hypothetical protein ACOSP7_018021 [Xanthoceras sorbifolium]
MTLRPAQWLYDSVAGCGRVSTRPSTNDSTRAAKQRPGGNNECVPEAGRGAADNPRAGSCDVALVGLESKDQTTGLPLQHAEVQDVGQGSGIGRGGGLGSTKEFHKVSPATTKVNPPVSSLFFFGSSDLNDECLGDSGLSTTQKGKSVGNSSLVESDDSTLTSFVRKATWKRRARKSNDSQLVEVEMEDNGPHKRVTTDQSCFNSLLLIIARRLVKLSGGEGFILRAAGPMKKNAMTSFVLNGKSRKLVPSERWWLGKSRIVRLLLILGVASLFTNLEER